MDGVFRQLLAFPLDLLPFVIIALIVAFTVHEFAHAYFATKFGDPTAKEQGRVTLNPRAHLDFVGTLLIIIAGFGWARPVPVDRSRFKHPRLMGIITTFAGPFSNLLLAFIGIAIYHALLLNGWSAESSGTSRAIEAYLQMHILLNVRLFIFNLIPLPPLDGYRIIEDVTPNKFRPMMARYEQWGIFIFLLLVFVRPLYHVTLGPLIGLERELTMGMARLLGTVFGYSF